MSAIETSIVEYFRDVGYVVITIAFVALIGVCIKMIGRLLLSRQNKGRDKWM